MKKLMLIASLFSSTCSFAQNGFFLQPEAGVGMGNAFINRSNFLGFVERVYPPRTIASYTAQLSIGYQVHQWRVSTGAAYLISGYNAHYVAGDFLSLDIKEKKQDAQLLIPLIVSYQLRLNDRLYLAPGIGMAVSYNISEKENINDGGYVTTNQTLTGSAFDMDFNRTSLWASAQAMLGYKLSKQLDIIAGPKAQFMLTSILKDATEYQRNYTYALNAGIVWHLKKSVATSGSIKN